jgi:hypothetical protein
MDIDALNEQIDAMRTVIELYEQLPNIDIDALNEQADAMRTVIELHDELPA